MKKKLLCGVAVVLVLVGLSLLIIPNVSNQINKEHVHSIIEEFKGIVQQNNQPDVFSDTDTNKSVSPSEESPEHRDAESSGQGQKEHMFYQIDSDRLYLDSTAYNERLKTEQFNLLINESSYQQPSLNLQDYGMPNNVYGYISSSAIDLELPIYLGATTENMAYGAAHLTYTSLPIGGESTNCVLAAHTGYIGRIFFDYISTLQYGDKVQITNLWNTLTYQVIEKRICKSYESSDCYITDGKDLLTLITCAHGGTDRFYVICERTSI